MANTAATPAAFLACAKRGIIIREPTPTKPTPNKVLEG